MISFVWPPGAAMLGGTGGSETYTAGHVRELMRRGIAAQVVTIGHGTKDGRQDFRDIPFVALANENEISHLQGTVVFVNKAYPVSTLHKPTIILHCSIPKSSDRERYKSFIVDSNIIATSVYSAQQWGAISTYQMPVSMSCCHLPIRYLAASFAPSLRSASG